VHFAKKIFFFVLSLLFPIFRIFNRSEIALFFMFSRNWPKWLTATLKSTPHHSASVFIRTSVPDDIVATATATTATTEATETAAATTTTATTTSSHALSDSLELLHKPLSPLNTETDGVQAIYAVQPMKRAVFDCVLNTKLLGETHEGGAHTFDLALVNLYNSYDNLKLQLLCNISKFDVLFQNIDPRGYLVLPTVEYPSQSKGVESVLTLRRQNIHDNPINAHFSVSLRELKPFSVSCVSLRLLCPS
jgi:hypothetical protein